MSFFHYPSGSSLPTTLIRHLYNLSFKTTIICTPQKPPSNHHSLLNHPQTLKLPNPNTQTQKTFKNSPKPPKTPPKKSFKTSFKASLKHPKIPKKHLNILKKPQKTPKKPPQTPKKPPKSFKASLNTPKTSRTI